MTRSARRKRSVDELHPIHLGASHAFPGETLDRPPACLALALSARLPTQVRPGSFEPRSRHEPCMRISRESRAESKAESARSPSLAHRSSSPPRRLARSGPVLAACESRPRGRRVRSNCIGTQTCRPRDRDRVRQSRSSGRHGRCSAAIEHSGDGGLVEWTGGESIVRGRGDIKDVAGIERGPIGCHFSRRARSRPNDFNPDPAPPMGRVAETTAPRPPPGRRMDAQAAARGTRAERERHPKSGASSPQRTATAPPRSPPS
jgi:hypothetical protein